MDNRAFEIISNLENISKNKEARFMIEVKYDIEKRMYETQSIYDKKKGISYSGGFLKYSEIGGFEDSEDMKKAFNDCMCGDPSKYRFEWDRNELFESYGTAYVSDGVVKIYRQNIHKNEKYVEGGNEYEYVVSNDKNDGCDMWGYVDLDDICDDPIKKYVENYLKDRKSEKSFADRGYTWDTCGCDKEPVDPRSVKLNGPHHLLYQNGEPVGLYYMVRYSID